MMVRRLSDTVRITRREFIKFVGFATLSAFAGVGFAGCSGQGQTEFKPSTSNTPNTPQNTGYKLIYPDWTKPVPDDVISHIIEIGRKYIEVWAPGALVCDVEGIEGDISAYMVKKGMRVCGLSTNDARFSWTIGDVDANYEECYEAITPQFGKELANFMDFVNNNMSSYGLILIRGPSGNNAYFNATFIEEGGGKVASFVAVHPKVDDLKRYWKEYDKYKVDYKIYAFHSKDKLDKMMLGVLEGSSAKNPHLWYLIPDKILEKGNNWHELGDLI